MDDPAKVIVAISFFSAITISIRAIASAAVRFQEMKLRGPSPIPSMTEARLERIEHAVDAIAIEIERISEGQRFTTKLLNDRVASPHDYRA